MTEPIKVKQYKGQPRKDWTDKQWLEHAWIQSHNPWITEEDKKYWRATQETKITVMQLKIERLEEKQDELRERLKVVEKWVIGAAAVLAAGVTVIGFATNISKAYL